MEDPMEDVSNNERQPLLLHPGRYEPRGTSSTSFGLLTLIAPALLLGIIVKAFDIAFLSTSYSRIASELQHFKDGSWIQLTASICSAIFVPLYSYLLKAFGIRRMLFLAYISFAIGACLCGVSSSFWQLLCSRFVMGLGSSGITLLSMLIINDIVGIKDLTIWESFVTCLEMATSIVAGPLGAWMNKRLTWHSVFYLEFAFMAMAVVILYYTLVKVSSNTRYSQSILLQKGDFKVRRVDIEGWILLLLAVTLPLIAVTAGDNFLEWSHPVEIILLVSGPVLICSFIIFETQTATIPIIDMTPVFKSEYLRVLFQVFGVILILNAVVSIIPPYIQVRSFNDPSFESFALTCVFLGFPLGAFIGGYLIKVALFPVQGIMLANAVALQGFCLLFLTRAIKPESSHNAPFLTGFGICTGAWQSCLLYATLSSTDKKWWFQTLALYYLVETFGGDLGMALMATITRVVAKSGIRSSLGNSEATEQIITDAMQDLERIRQLDDKSQALVLASFENAMHLSFLLPCSMAAVVVLLATGMNIWPGKARYGGAQQ